MKKIVLWMSGAMWMGVGIFLMIKGVGLLKMATPEMPLLRLMGKMSVGYEQAVPVLLALSLVVGIVKGRTALARAAGRLIRRLEALPEGAPWYAIYPVYYYCILAGMMGMGMLIRWSGLSLDIVGMIDATIGCALIQGSVVYLRQATARVARV